MHSQSSEQLTAKNYSQDIFQKKTRPLNNSNPELRIPGSTPEN